MGTYDKKVNQLKDLMKRKYKSVYDKSKEIDIDISSMTYLPKPDVFDVMYAEHMSVILGSVWLRTAEKQREQSESVLCGRSSSNSCFSFQQFSTMYHRLRKNQIPEFSAPEERSFTPGPVR